LSQATSMSCVQVPSIFKSSKCGETWGLIDKRILVRVSCSIIAEPPRASTERRLLTIRYPAKTRLLACGSTSRLSDKLNRHKETSHLNHLVSRRILTIWHTCADATTSRENALNGRLAGRTTHRSSAVCRRMGRLKFVDGSGR